MTAPTHARRTLACLGLALALVGAGCSSPSSDGGSRATTTTVHRRAPAAAPALHGHVHVSVEDPAHCSMFATRTCLAPFPDDRFTVADRSTPTGRRVEISSTVTPQNEAGARVDTTEWNRNDGFSPAQPIVAFLGDVDPGRSHLAPVTDIGASLAPDAPIAIIDAATGARHPYWAELDAGARAKGERHPALFIRPAVDWTEGHRYLIALRGLKDARGRALPANAVFAAYRDGVRTDDPQVERHRAETDAVLADLSTYGIGRSHLDLAWGFTVASTKGLTERLLHIRDDAMADLGETGAPKFEVRATDPADQADGGARIVEGTFEVPRYLDHDGAPGGRFVDGPDGLPTRTGTFTAKFTCVLPSTAASTAKPGAQGIVYGHGLLGDRGEVLGFGGYAIDHHSVVCATDWVGLAEEDVGQAVKVLQDLSNLPSLVDRSQQGFVDFQYLARLLKSPDGFGSDPAFQVDGRSLLKPDDVAYWGRSQGGIYGGAATAISTEWTRAVLGEPGIAYSTLLDRSVDFDDYAVVQRNSYPDTTVWPILASLLQMVWDRGEPSGYAAHMTDHPLPGTPAHRVLLFEAFGDHQVTNVATEVEARTIGAKLKPHALASGRSRDRHPFWGIDVLDRLPAKGSALYVWDFGTPAAPAASLPNRQGDDPHDMDADTPSALDVVAAFLERGAVIDACDGRPCNAPPQPD